MSSRFSVLAPAMAAVLPSVAGVEFWYRGCSTAACAVRDTDQAGVGVA